MGTKFPAIASRGGRWLVVLSVLFLALTSMLKAIPTHNAAGYLENYSAQGNLDSVVDANGRTTSFTYNKRRQRTGETADTGGVAATANAAFDNQARVATVTAPADNAGQRPQQSLTYNPTDKVRLKKLNNVTVEETAYDSRDWASTAKDAANRTTTFVRKANGDLAGELGVRVHFLSFISSECCFHLLESAQVEMNFE